MAFAWPLTTDQRECYDSNGISVSCAASGQDAAQTSHRKDAVDRFQVRGDMVFDKSTGLYWCRNANPFDFPYTWEEAFDRLADLNRSALGGRHDWRLPSRRELFSIISHQNINPALPSAHLFRNVFPGYYWTATACSRLPDQAWYIHFGGARVYRGMKSGAYLVWPVAGSRPQADHAEKRFRSTESVIQDCATGLYWTRRPCCGSSRLTWDDAINSVNRLNQDNFDGRSPWRLPNVRELDSLVDLARHSPALPDGHPFDDIQEGYWCATTSTYEPRYAWVLYMRDGAIGVGYKPQPTFSAWAVTGGKQTTDSLEPTPSGRP
jgi:hypothetical protein